MSNIIWFIGMPRSGTNWLGQFFDSSPHVRFKLCPVFSYDFITSMDEQSTPQKWKAFFEKVYETKSEYLDQDFLRREGAVPLLEQKDEHPEHLVIKSIRFHNLIPSILEKHPAVRFVSIVRHPCAVIHSWLTNPLEFPAGEDPMLQWRSGACRKTGPGEFWGFDDWKTVTSLHMDLAKKYPERFFFIKFEELVQDASAQISELFVRLDIAYTTQTDTFLKASQATHSEFPRSVFKSPAVKDRWQKEMHPVIREAILKELSPAFDWIGYKGVPSSVK